MGDIPLTDDVLQLLKSQRNYWGFKVESTDRYLFCNEKGEPLSRERVQSEIEHIIKQIRAAGHEFERITPHVFICNTGNRGRDAAAGIENYSGPFQSSNDDGSVFTCAS